MDEVAKLKRQNEILRKDLIDAYEQIQKLKYDKIICPGEAARYYLEETRRLKTKLKYLGVEEP